MNRVWIIECPTLSPTQCAMWLRMPVPPEKRNFFYRGFNSVYDVAERWYAHLISRMVHVSYITVTVALVLIGIAIWGLTRVPTGFLPTEDQGYVLIGAQLPDAASLQRTDEVMKEISDIASKTPGVQDVLAISGISVLDNNATLPNAGVAYVMLKGWDERDKKGEGLLWMYETLNKELQKPLKNAERASHQLIFGLT